METLCWHTAPTHMFQALLQGDENYVTYTVYHSYNVAAGTELVPRALISYQTRVCRQL
jgi:hypothetical protein